MATKTIYVSLQGQGNSTNLRLVDSEGHDGVNDITTNVDPNDIVIWEVNPNPPAGSQAIRYITNVYKKTAPDPTNYSLLIANPTPNAARNFQGTVVPASQSPGSGKKESYSIDYTRTNGTTGSDDPKLNMN